MKESLKILGSCFRPTEGVNPDHGSRNLADTNAPETVRGRVPSRLSRISTAFEHKPKEEPKSGDSNPQEKKSSWRHSTLSCTKTLFERKPKPKVETKTDKEIIHELRTTIECLGTELERLKAEVKRPPIYLITDFGGGDHAQAECLGAIYNECRVNDIASPKIIEAPNVDKFNIYHGSSVLKQLASGAGEGAILVGVVDPGVGSKTREVRKGVVIKTGKGKYLIGPDNGIFTDVILDEGVESSYYIDEGAFLGHSTTFHGRDIFSPAAARISSGIDIKTFAQPCDPDMLKMLEFRTGTVRHLDTYGNIKLELKENKNASALIVGGVRVEVKNSFGDAEVGALLAYIGSSGGGMEIGVNQGDARKMFNPKVGEQMTLYWELKDGTRVPISRSKADSDVNHNEVLAM